MEPSVYIPTLQELALVKMSIILWNRENLREYTRRDSHGCVHIERALPIIKKLVNALRLPVKIENLLTDVSERVGYEICSFMTQSILNSSDMESFSRGAVFCDYTVVDLNLSEDVQWTSGGEISAEKTLTSFMQNHPQASPLLFFLSACETGHKSLVLKVWNNLSDEQKLFINNSLSWTETDVFLGYWTCLLQNQLDTYFKIYENNNIIINSKSSIYYYLVMHSIGTCFKSRANYFFSKLEETEKKKFIQVVDINGKKPILLGQIKYSFKFFEAPILNHHSNKLVLESLSVDEFEYLIDYLLSEINDSSDMHANVLLYVISNASEDVKSWTLTDPDFHFFLISKGRFDIVEMLVYDQVKHDLKEEVMAAFDLSELPPSMKQALTSEYSNKLNDFIDIIADGNDDDASTLKNCLKSLNSHCIFDPARLKVVL